MTLPTRHLLQGKPLPTCSPVKPCGRGKLIVQQNQLGRTVRRQHMTCIDARRTRSGATAPPASEIDMQEKADFLRKDLTHLFDDQGIDQSAYDDKVLFEDPITKYSNVQGYIFNIKMLRRVFAPTFQLHDIRQTAEHELTTRWTMSMQLTLNKYNPLRKYWDPQLLFTGTSIMGVNPLTGRFNKHVDTWDAVRNQKYLSLEAVRHLFGQLLTFSTAPKLDSPVYTVLKKPSGYEVRKYGKFVVAETDMESSKEANPSQGTSANTDPRDDKTSSQNSNPAGNGTSAFRVLAGYLFGKNARQEKMAMTMPVFSDSSGKMQFFMGSGKDQASLPAPSDPQVRCVEVPGGLYAVRSFSGISNQQQAAAQLAKLQAAVARDKVLVASDDWLLARYNDPSTKAPFRRNEVMVPVRDFDIWAPLGR